MASIARPTAFGGAWPPWSEIAGQVLQSLGADPSTRRDAIVLVPYAALLDPVRVAFAAHAGWQPRVETPLTLSASLGPDDASADVPGFGEPALERLQAGRWLAGLAWPDPIDALDGRQRAHFAALVADAAAALVRAAACRPPAARAAWWAAVTAALPAAGDGPGALETALLRLAVAWAQGAAVPATDRLFTLRPAAWVVLTLGGADPLADAVLQASTCGGVAIDLDVAGDDPFVPGAGQAPPRLRVAEDFEAEAQAAAAEVVEALSRSDGRVALVALDRALVRRITALLQHAGVELDDETGWRLSTSAAAGRVLARLRAAVPGAGGDDRLDWLKRWPPAVARPAALRALEALWRSGRNARIDAGSRAAAEALWQQAQAVLDAWRQPRQRGLGDWIGLLSAQLADDGEADELSADPAGQRVLQLLHDAREHPVWRRVLREAHGDAAAFADWFADWCEGVTVQRPPRPASRVVLTPLARAVGRPFAQVVVAGADARRLGRDERGAALIGDTLAARLGLETADERRRRQQLALAALLRMPAVTLIWRRLDGDAPLAPAPAIDALRAAWRQAGRPLPVQEVRPTLRRVPAMPVARPRPVATQDLPPRLSASAVESLRQCPYRFFARAVLRLAEADEVDAPADKRVYGDWLHATLHRFHRDRRPGEDDLAALQRAADAELPALAVEPASLLAFRASMAQVLPAYRDWLARHEAAGWRWQAGEDALEAAPAGWAPQRLHGRIDRVDLAGDGRRLVIDYKTGQAQALKSRVGEPLEDTQLPFYAALLRAQGAAGPIEACYLALDERDGPKAVPHPDVEQTAEVLLHGLAGELQRLRDGAALPALGEGAVCDLCEARGLCRRDHWPAEPPA